MTKMMPIRLITAGLLLVGSMNSRASAGPNDVPTFVPQGERSEKAIGGGRIPFWPERPDQAEVLTATFIGGRGHEWLVGGGFQSDGTVVLAGNIAGGVFDLDLQGTTVIGRDGVPSADPVREKDKKGNELPLSWQLDGITGFVVRLSPDLKRVINVARMPWNSGAITSIAVDPKGNIFVAGKATATFENLGGNQQALPVDPDITRKGGGCDRTFLARLSPEGNQCVWGRSFEGKSDAPTIKMGRDGNLTYGAQDLRRFDVDGNQLSVTVVPGGVTENKSVSPIDGSIAWGGEHSWPTGREPWRCPFLHVSRADGTHSYQLYEWPGPFVGMDNCRLVSDSAIQMVSHDKEGNILLVAWSDGGNSVMTCLPTDVRTGVGFRGVGLNAAGAGATSFAYLVKLEPKDYQVIGWTFWGTRYNGRGNAITVRALAQADDGSFCVAGAAAWGLYQTPNFIGRSEPAGSYVAVLTPDMSGVRFCSAIPGTGVATIGNKQGDIWGIGVGSVNGQPRVLFTSGAIAESDNYGHMSSTPTVNPLQPKFGGGWSDGYVVVLDLSKGADQLPRAEVSPRAVAKRLTVHKTGQAVGGKPPPEIADGTMCYFLPNYPRYVTMDVEARDAAGKMWPSFVYGRSVEGALKYTANGAQGTVFGLADQWCQTRGLQDRRVLGELISPDKDGKVDMPVNVSFLSLGPVKTEEYMENDNNGREIKKSVTYQEAIATLDLGGRKLTIRPKCVIRWHPPSGRSTQTRVELSAFITVKGRDLGLTKLANEDIDLRINMQGYDQKSPPPKNKR
jgi:hypothetical protein